MLGSLKERIVVLGEGIKSQFGAETERDRNKQFLVQDQRSLLTFKMGGEESMKVLNRLVDKLTVLTERLVEYMLSMKNNGDTWLCSPILWRSFLKLTIK